MTLQLLMLGAVNHPHVVDHYRTAHSIAVKRRAGDGATEQLRQAFVHYRALFADLLEVPGTNGEDATERAEPAEAAERAEPSVATAAPIEPASGQRSQLASRPMRDVPAHQPPTDATDVAPEAPVDSARSAR